jgi:branched-subunit amino acid transport protein
MDQTTLLLTVFGVAAVSLAIRAAPLLLLSGRRLPRVMEEMLEYVPAAALAALTMQLLAVREGVVLIAPDDVRWWALLPTIAIAAWRRSMLLTVFLGVALVAGLRLVTG